MTTSLHTHPIVRAALVLLLGALPALACAHPGEAGGWWHGLAHPFVGMDHLCAMLAVGLWAAQLGGRATWAVPLGFLLVMALGTAVPVLPFFETGIVASVLVLGVLIAAAVRLPLPLSVLIVGTFALFHGAAHGAEMPQGASGLAYALGFISATVSLHVSGLALGMLARANLVRFAGAAVAVFGGYLGLAA